MYSVYVYPISILIILGTIAYPDRGPKSKPNEEFPKTKWPLHTIQLIETLFIPHNIYYYLIMWPSFMGISWKEWSEIQRDEYNHKHNQQPFGLTIPSRIFNSYSESLSPWLKLLRCWAGPSVVAVTLSRQPGFLASNIFCNLCCRQILY